MMTEEEAKTKWCPFARASHVRYNVRGETIHNIETHNLNRVDEGAWPTSCRCIASQCAAWRWDFRGWEPGNLTTTPPDKWLGHCGLSGPR